MNRAHVFYPPVRQGLVIHSAAVLLLLAGGSWGIWQTTQASIGPVFLFYLLPSLLFLALATLLVYRAYALARAYYVLERDGIHLHWGLRSESIPIDQVTWIRRADELGWRLSLPWLRLPGGILGERRQGGVGLVEYLAASTRDMILIATPERAFAITPRDPDAFMRTYSRFVELGSLSPLSALSVSPNQFLGRVWSFPAARGLLLTGALLSLLLFVWTSLVIPGLSQVSLGFLPSGAPRDPIPGVRLLLLPVLNTLIFSFDALLGLFFFRSESSRPLAYLLWLGGALTPLVFLLGVYFSL